MAKFTDDFFVFPIKIYDGFSLKKAMKEEEDEFSTGPVPIDWVVGQVRIPAKDLHKLVWHDGFSRDRTVEDVAREGFDTTIVISDVYGDFVCTWSRKKFEDRLNDFMERWQAENMKSSMSMPFMSIAIPYGDGTVVTSSTFDSPEGATSSEKEGEQK